ncbi:hypothetical protein H6G89_22045 [Oscillatoria sp. FACHB-1407]|uniref:hypothetical protein n=1 Tax=Oscillatoria sp. FACHB-1407 TaxID=2692847 RepID=UPI001682A440|nr:hypothetical protein [Oscillatoria sp. FACHB-1407]MBD2463686.1 hypothetical protein [Oscillatoria sp. FACHB-1407]
MVMLVSSNLFRSWLLPYRSGLVSLLALSAIALPSLSQPAMATSLNQSVTLSAQASATTTNRSLPRIVANQVLLDASQRLGISRDQLQIQDYQRRIWSDSCLGLGDINESCALVTVPGWQITVTHGQQRLVYHTDLAGRSLRLSRDSQTLPSTVSDRLLQHASTESGVPVSELEVVSAEPQFWDGCLGIYVPNDACAAIGISGWRAVVSSPSQSWVYHMNGDGSGISLNTTASDTSLVPQFMPDSTRPNLGSEVIFQMSREGGFAGQSIQVMLLADGQVMQPPPHADGSSVPHLLNQLTPQQIEQFIQFLEQHQFQNFNGLTYPAPQGSADYFTITLTSQSGTTQYTDIALDQLPPQLQAIIQQWEQLQRQQ